MERVSIGESLPVLNREKLYFLLTAVRKFELDAAIIDWKAKLYGY